MSIDIIPGASSVVELWFAVADFPKCDVGADVATKAALLALLLAQDSVIDQGLEGSKSLCTRMERGRA
jgi:hypothetical protein